MDDLTPADCRRILSVATIGHLGVISEDEPYVSPISFVYEEGSIYVRTTPGRRVDAIRANPRVCMEVSDFDATTGYWESMIVWGDATFIEDRRTSERVVMALMDKYRDTMGSPLSRPGSAPMEQEIILRIPVEVETGRSSGSYFSARTLPGRL